MHSLHSKFFSSICFSAIVLVTSCTTMPSLPAMGQSEAIRQIVNRLQCEVYRSVDDLKDLKDKDGLSWVRNYVAKAVLTLQVNSDGTIAPSSALLGPFANGAYTLGISAGLTSAANRTATYGFNIDFAKATHTWCDYDVGGYAPLQGDLGIQEWISTVLRSRDGNDPFPRPKSISHRVDFTLDAKVEVGPAYVLTRSRSGAALSVHRKDFHTLDIAMEYLSVADRNATFDSKVCIVNLPGPCYVPPVRVAEKPKPAEPPKLPPTYSAPAPESFRLDQKLDQPRRPSRSGAISREPREIPPDVQQRLDRALQNLELRSIGPRF